jgi:predicted permease
MSDLRFAIRQLAKSPGFTIVAVLVLALGIGANATIFSIINSILIKPLHVLHPEQLVGVYQHDQDNPNAFTHFSYLDFADLRANREVAFTDLFAFRYATVGLQGGLTERIAAEFVSANYFSALGVLPAQGRFFLPEEELSGTEVAVLTHSFWKRLGADPNIVGQKIKLTRAEVTVVGVMPSGFTGAQILAPEIFFPLGLAPILNPNPGQASSRILTDRADHSFMLMGRLKAGVTLANADQALAPLNRQFPIADPAETKARTLVCRPPSRFNFSPQPARPIEGLAPVAAFASGLSILVLLVACLNLANMMLARGSARQTEIAIRLALGAGARRIVSQLLTEGVVLAMLGGVAGLLVSFWSTNLLSAFIYSGAGMPPDFPKFDLAPDWRLLLVLLFLAGMATLVFALGPAWKMSRVEVNSDLKRRAGEHGPEHRNRFGSRELLAVGQMAFSLALLAAAALFSRSAMNVVQANPGFEFGSNFYLSVDPGLSGYSAPRTRQLMSAALERLSTLPGVESVSAATSIPFGNSWNIGSVQIGGAPPSSAGAATFSAGKELYTIQNEVEADYFRTLGLPLLRGREFERGESLESQAPRVAIISRSLADQFWPGENPIGRSIQFPGAVPTVMTVVGVAPEVSWQVFQKGGHPQMYLPFPRDFSAGFNLHVRVAPGFSASQLMAVARKALVQLDPQLPLTGVKTLSALHHDSPVVRVTGFGSILFGTFGGLALLLSLLGIYGLKAFAVARRTREIGIRMALGANRREVVVMFLTESAWLMALGLTMGLALALIVGRLAEGFLYHVAKVDPLTFSVVPLIMFATSLLACIVPASRAAKLDPMTALRYE